MGFEVRKKREIFKIENLGVGPHVFFSDMLGTNDATIKNPIVGSWFRIEDGPKAAPPEYTYDEAGVVTEGSITLQDEAGNVQTLSAGDTFLIHRGSTIQFSSSDYGIAFKCGSRLKSNL